MVPALAIGKTFCSGRRLPACGPAGGIALVGSKGTPKRYQVALPRAPGPPATFRGPQAAAVFLHGDIPVLATTAQGIGRVPVRDRCFGGCPGPLELHRAEEFSFLGRTVRSCRCSRVPPADGRRSTNWGERLASLAVENYVKAIFKLSQSHPAGRATTGQLATEVHVSPGTVTAMLKGLSQHGLATYTPYEGVRLTEAGRRLALAVVRRHRLLELFLAQSLGLEWDEVHEHAEHLEHAVSDGLLERIDAFLGYPQFDPHGDPIPNARGEMAELPARPLSTCRLGERFRLVRVLEQSPGFLRALRGQGWKLGSVGQIVECQAPAGTVAVALQGRRIALDPTAAETLLVEVPPGRAPK